MLKAILVCAIFVVACWMNANAQENFGSFSIDYLTPDDGLSQGSNYFRFEDSKGFMWLTCNDAINRYDGKTVKVYNLDRYFDKCPNLQQGYGIVEDKNGNLYIGSVRGLYIYHRKRDQFTLQKIYPNQKDAIAMPIAIRDGKVWCYNKSFQLATFDIASKKVTQVARLKLDPLPSIHVYELMGYTFYARFPFMDKDGNLWFVEENEVLNYNLKTRIASNPFKSISEAKNIQFKCAAYDQKKNLLYLGFVGGILIHDLNTGKTSIIDKIQTKKLGNINQVAVRDNMLVLKSDLEVLFINRKNLTMSPFQMNFQSEVHRYGFGFDKSNRFWFCNDGKGQVIFNFRKPLLNKIPTDFKGVEIFKHSGVGRIAEFPENKILIPVSNMNKYYELVHNLSNEELTINESPFDYSAFSYGMVTDYGRKGVWCFEGNMEKSGYTNTIFFKNDRGIKQHIANSELINPLGKIIDLSLFGNDRLILATSKGLYWFYPKTMSNALISKTTNLFKINVLDEKHFAVSYINKPLTLFRVEANNQIQLSQKILPKVQSFYIEKDKKRNRYWVGTNEGVILLDKNFKTLKIFNANVGLAGNYIYGLLLDDRGDVYCSHQRGLSSINATNFQIINFDKRDGIQNWDFNNKAFCKTKNGTLVFGGISGYNYFKPPLIPYSYYKPEVYIDEILVNNTSYDLSQNANYLQKLTLNHRQTSISISAFVKDLEHAHARELIYRIKEINANWEHITNGSKINFNNLAPNTYTLQLGVYDKYSAKEIHQKTLKIVISAPFYYKLWFWVFVGVIFSGIVFWLYNRQRLRKQQLAFQQQLALEQQRSKITADLHDDIGSTLSSLQINSAVANQLLEKNPKEAQVVLQKIENQSKNLADKIGDIIWSMKPGKDEFISMSSRIKNFANDILGSREIFYSIDIDPAVNLEITDITMRKNIVLLTKEALNNAAKYSQAKRIDVVLKKSGNSIYLSIQDDGIGFDAENITGNGLANMQKRVTELNGVFQLKSAKNAGTKIEAILPCP